MLSGFGRQAFGDGMFLEDIWTAGNNIFFIRQAMGKNMKRISQNNFGFTIFEMMVVIAVIGIIAAIAIPNIGAQMRAYRFSASIRNLQSAVQNARMEAIRRNASACMAIDLVEDVCTTFVDTNADGIQNAGEPTLNMLPMPEGVDIVAPVAPGNVIQFNSRGMPAVAARIAVRNMQGDFRGIDIGFTGNSRIVRSGDGGATWF